MSIIKDIETDIKNVIENLGYQVETFTLKISDRPDLGDYQINDCMTLAKIYHKNPREIADIIKKELDKDTRLTNINIAGPGFINITLSDEFLIDSMNKIFDNIDNNIDKVESKKIILDYGGANAAKALHVGHMRSANIGEAIKRLASLLGNDVLGDVHLGDLGRQAGMVISELKREQPQLSWFDSNYQGEFPPLNITNEDLGRLYPKASLAAKDDEKRMEEVRQITAAIDKGDKALTDLWTKIVDISSQGIKKTYNRLNCSFELWEGEMDACKYKDNVLDIFKDYLYESQGALVIDVQEKTDKKEMSPLIVIKSDGATIYATRDLGTIYSRMERFSPDEIWYFTDERQSLYFEQIFRASYKTGLVPKETILGHYSFGTMNGSDGKPFKTRDGGVMELEKLIELVKKEVIKRIREDIVGDEREKIAEDLTIATLKYADLLPFRGTDYIFDIQKFSELEGKTGPYLLYSTIRMKSLLEKAKDLNQEHFTTISDSITRDVILTILKLPVVLTKSYEIKSLNEIAEYLYTLTNKYNKFYSENKILIEKDSTIRESWLVLTNIVYRTNLLLLDTLGIKVPEKM